MRKLLLIAGGDYCDEMTLGEKDCQDRIHTGLMMNLIQNYGGMDANLVGQK